MPGAGGTPNLGWLKTLSDDIAAVQADVGTLSNLTTTDKTSIVAAVNEIVTNITIIEGLNDINEDTAALQDIIDNVPDNTPWTIDPRGDFQLNVVDIPRNKWVSFVSSTGAIFHSNESRDAGQDPGTYWLGVLTFGYQAGTGYDINSNIFSPSASYAGWTAFTGAMDKGDTEFNNATIAAEVSALLAADPDDPVFVFFSSGVENTGEEPTSATGRKYGQSVSIRVVEGDILYFNEPLITDIPNGTQVGPRLYRVVTYPYTHRVENITFISEPNTVGKPLRNGFASIIAATTSIHTKNVRVRTMSGIKLYNCHDVHVSDWTINGRSLELEPDPPFGSYYTFGLYPSYFMHTATFENCHIQNVRHATDPNNGHGTMVNVTFRNIVATSTFQNCFNSHAGGRATFVDCTAYQPDASYNGGSYQPYAFSMRAEGTHLKNIKVYHDMKSASAVAIVCVAAGCQIDGADITTTSVGISLSDGGGLRVRNARIRLDTNNYYPYGSSDGINGVADTNFWGVRGNPAIVIGSPGDPVTLDIDDVDVYDFGLIYLMAGAHVDSRYRFGKNINGHNLTQRSTSSTFNLKEGARTLWTSLSRDEGPRFKLPCVISLDEYSTSEFGLSFGMPTFPTLDTDFSICFFAKFSHKGVGRSVTMFSSNNEVSPMVEIGKWSNDTFLRTFVSSGGTTVDFSNVSATGYYDDAIHHFCLVFDKDNGSSAAAVKFYIDGAQVGGTKTSAPLLDATFVSTSVPTLLRRHYADSQEQFLGYFADFRVYKTLLNDSQIVAIADDDPSVVIPAPDYWLPCDEERGRRLKDALGSGYALLHSATAVFGDFWGEM